MQLRCFLLDVDYVTLNGRAVIRLWLKDERGQNIIAYDSSFEPYFYAVTDDRSEERFSRTAETDIVCRLLL